MCLAPVCSSIFLCRSEVWYPVSTPSIVEYLFTQSSSLETAGWSFQSLRNHERGHEFPEAVREAYLLSIPDE